MVQFLAPETDIMGERKYIYHCPNTKDIIHNIIKDYFPNTNPTNYFSISDILIDSTHYNHQIYNGSDGKLLINIIWDIFQVAITTAHTAGKAPTYANTNKLIISTLTDITKLLPKSQVCKKINDSVLLFAKIN